MSIHILSITFRDTPNIIITYKGCGTKVQTPLKCFLLSHKDVCFTKIFIRKSIFAKGMAHRGARKETATAWEGSGVGCFLLLCTISNFTYEMVENLG